MQVILVCGNLWNLWNWPTMTRNRPTWPEIGPTWPEIGPTWPQHPPTAEPHKINMIWLDIWRKICVVTSLTFRSQMSQIFNRQPSIFCYPSFVNGKSFQMKPSSRWLEATGEYFTRIRGRPPCGKKSTCWQSWQKMKCWRIIYLQNYSNKMILIIYKMDSFEDDKY